MYFCPQEDKEHTYSTLQKNWSYRGRRASLSSLGDQNLEVHTSLLHSGHKNEQSVSSSLHNGPRGGAQATGDVDHLVAQCGT